MTATSRTTQVRARERAREQLAERRAAQRAREEANEADLVTFFAAAEQVDTAAMVRDRAVAAATRTYEDTVAAATGAQQSTIRTLRTRGEAVTDIAELTGWSAADVRKAIKADQPERTTATTTTAAGDAPRGDHDDALAS